MFQCGLCMQFVEGDAFLDHECSGRPSARSVLNGERLKKREEVQRGVLEFLRKYRAGLITDYTLALELVDLVESFMPGMRAQNK